MINLLPPQEKRVLLSETNKRLALVLCFGAVVVLACLILMLLSLYFYLLVQLSFQKEALDEAKGKYQTADFLEYKNLIGQYNAVLSKTDDFYKKEVYIANALKEIAVVEKPQAVRLQSIAMEPLKNGSVKVTATGTADSRANLLLFKNALQARKQITNLQFPPDNWIKPANITFLATFEIMPIAINAKPQ